MFSAVGFDLGDTLVEYEGIAPSWQSAYPAALQAVAATLGLVPADSAWQSANEVLVRYNTRLTPRDHEIEDAQLFGELFLALGSECAPSPVVFDAAVDAFFSVFRSTARAVGGGRETVANLNSAGVPVGVLTDTAYAMPRRLVEDDLRLAGLHELVDSTLTSVEVGWRKPRPEGFRRLADLLGMSPSDLLYVGNEAKDIEGAMRAGAGGVLLWREDGPVPEWGQCATVAELGEVLELIG